MCSITERLQIALLSKIFSHVEGCRDIIICSTVCKAWYEAALDVHPTGLYFPHYGKRNVSAATVVAFTRWLEHKQSAGHFDHLQDLHVVIEDYEADIDVIWRRAYVQGDRTQHVNSHEEDAADNLLHAINMLLPGPPLNKCHIAGPISIAHTVRLLPDTVQQLHLQTTHQELSAFSRLSIFTKFEDLQALAMYPRKARNRNSAHSFLLDCRLPVLQNLTLDPAVLRQKPGMSFKKCLPRIQNVAVHVPSHAASSCLQLPSLKYLRLILHDNDPEPVANIDSCLRVPAACSLEELSLVQMCHTEMHVDIWARPQLSFSHSVKSDYRCGGNTFLAGPVRVYKPPDGLHCLNGTMLRQLLVSTCT